MQETRVKLKDNDYSGLEIKINIDDVFENNYTCLFSCKVTCKDHRFGVGFAIKNQWINGVQHVEYRNDRMMWVGGIFEGFAVVFVIVYAPAGSDGVAAPSTIDKLDIFYQDVKEMIREILVEYLAYKKIILGDFNAQLTKDVVEVIGSDEDTDCIVGPFINQPAKCNEVSYSCTKMLQFCKETKLVIANTQFEDSDGATYHTPQTVLDGHYVYDKTLDYILVCEDLLSAMENCFVNIKGGFEPLTDHRMLQLNIVHSRPNSSDRPDLGPAVEEARTGGGSGIVKRKKKKNFGVLCGDKILAEKVKESIEQRLRDSVDLRY
jgi:hypothetical protein